ncbi:hypothetical protein GQ602_002611 [Ophiocordyceps camponoti-floridani]|uniref:protein-L-isoaspartate(D-aspartate) O-methyltransferase n=1 Tax=Ophiocordyceps camponoti-floridani TaxID=2030778 RepID=A0A8H4QAR4_9HYPO|nr:hypothetical protein GQ602_002611 [Ophiocordyceps camponoti-floridani]
MAWRCSGRSNAALVENLWRNGLITEAAVKEAFLRVDRAHYAPNNPYQDSPQPIGHEATISAPHMHASAAEHLLPFARPTVSSPAPRVLDVGSGSGYLTHVLAEMVGEAGLVVGLEHIAALRDLGEANMRRSVGEVHPQLLAQLKAPGCMFIPVEDRDSTEQYVWRIEKDGDGNVSRKRLFGVRYVPLTDAPIKT